MLKIKISTNNKSKRSPISEQETQRILEFLWLTYYNDTLYAQGVITEEEHKEMCVRIWKRKSSV